nr:zinc knuckle CX2CX4HX4C [Tanacetum cinerariifolium]
MIQKNPLTLNRWTTRLPLRKDEVTKVHVWVQLHKVPIVVYSEDGLSLNATQIGKPLMLEAFTSSMCVESWGRISFARDLVEISSDMDLKKKGKSDSFKPTLNPFDALNILSEEDNSGGLKPTSSQETNHGVGNGVKDPNTGVSSSVKKKNLV